ncbi:glycosyltransferase [Hydrogenivirga caldilitoris]|nr:glycosyltransferase [Hydrogenivirga caldilitoris]
MKSDILIIIPHYNNLKGLEKSLASISNIEPVDVLIIDDGSNEENKPDCKELKNKYKNINSLYCLINDKNRGIEYVLNDGLKYALKHDYKYIARLDCGDICCPERFRIQKEFLDKNPEIYLVGSYVEIVDTKGNTLFIYKPPIIHDEIRKKMCINNVFIHPSVMFRKEVIEEVGFYPLNYKYAEDYAFFYKIVKNLKVANINKVLLKYEVNPTGISLSKRKIQLKSRIKVILDFCDFSWIKAYSLIRNSIMFIVPYPIILGIKRILLDRTE